MRALALALRKSLFLKVYLTLLASLATVAVVGAMAIRLGQDDQDLSWRDRRDRFLAEILPPPGDPALQPTIERLARAVAGDVALFDAAGSLVALAGQPIPEAALAPGRPRFLSDRSVFAVKLADGRRVAMRLAGLPGRRGPLVFLLVIAVAIGIAAYPVVRHLTRRLETLRQGVEAWGSGKLVTRVEIAGSDEVAAVARSFNQAAQHVEELLAAHRLLLANASHELRSPLARLRMVIEIFEQMPRDAARQELVQNLAELDALVEEILLASRLDQPSTAIEGVPVDLFGLVAEEGARNAIPVTGEPATILGDAKLLRRLARNLMQNALRHGAPPVTAEVERRNGEIRFSVRDHGPGLPAEESARAFEPFYRPAGRAEAAGSWGLGLSLVRLIAGHHSAEAGHLTPPEGGACFFVVFPEAAEAGTSPGPLRRRSGKNDA